MVKSVKMEVKMCWILYPELYKNGYRDGTMLIDRWNDKICGGENRVAPLDWMIY